MTRATNDIMRNPRRGFTLIELMVSVAILMGLMAMITMVFSSASKASGQAQALTALNRVVSQLAENIRQDLEAMDPSSSILGIARVDVLAYTSTEDFQNRTLNAATNDPNSDWHRADVLMLVNQRKFDPYLYQVPSGAVVDFDPVRLVVYGHANFGTLNAAGTGWASTTDIEPATSGQPSPMPASRWVLAKRTIGFPVASNAPLASPPNYNVAPWPLVGDAFTGNTPGPKVFADVYRDSNFKTMLAARTLLGSTGGTYQYRSNDGTLIACFEDYSTAGAFYGSLNNASVWEDFRLYQKYWWKWNGGWTRTDVNPFAPLTPPQPTPPAFQDSYSVTKPGDWRQWFYAGGSTRTRLDRSPPAARSDLMACYFMPGCVDFKVEYTYDNPRELILDTMYYVTAIHEPLVTHKFDVDAATWLDTNGDGVVDDVPTPQAINWISVPTGQTWVWSHLLVTPKYYAAASPALDLRDLTLQGTTSAARPFSWPRAIRITLRGVDPAGRLDEPVTQTIIHMFK